MLIEKTNIFTGTTRILDMPVTRDQVIAWIEGANIQDAMPQLSADEREFFLSGTLPGEFEDALPEEE